MGKPGELNISHLYVSTDGRILLGEVCEFNNLMVLMIFH
jgi:hypothetical protein